MSKQPNFYNEAGELAKEGLPRVSAILDVRNKPELCDWKVRIADEFSAGEILRINEVATELGTMVHDAIETYVRDGDEVMLPNDYTVTIQGKEVVKSPQKLFQGFLNWCKKAEPVFAFTEIPIRSNLYGYAGRTDLVCKLNGDEWWIVDFKTSKRLNPGMGLQLAAYKQAYAEMTGMEPRTGILQLTTELKRGWRFKEYDEDFRVFLAHKRIYDWQQSHKKPAEALWSGKELQVA